MTRRLASALALVLAATGIPLVATGSAQAIPMCKSGYQCTRTYYATPGAEFPVGGWTRFCDGSTDTWGTTKGYIVVTQVRCQEL